MQHGSLYFFLLVLLSPTKLGRVQGSKSPLAHPYHLNNLFQLSPSPSSMQSSPRGIHSMSLTLGLTALTPDRKQHSKLMTPTKKMQIKVKLCPYANDAQIRLEPGGCYPRKERGKIWRTKQKTSWGFPGQWQSCTIINTEQWFFLFLQLLNQAPAGLPVTRRLKYKGFSTYVFLIYFLKSL